MAGVEVSGSGLDIVEMIRFVEFHRDKPQKFTPESSLVVTFLGVNIKKHSAYFLFKDDKGRTYRLTGDMKDGSLPFPKALGGGGLMIQSANNDVAVLGYQYAEYRTSGKHH